MSRRTGIVLAVLLTVLAGVWMHVCVAGTAVYAQEPAGDEKPVAENEVTAEPTEATEGETTVAEDEVTDETGVTAAEEDRELTSGEAFLKKLRQGGVTMIFLAACSVFGVAFTIERLVGLRRGVIAPAGLAEKADGLWRKGDYGEVAGLVKTKPCTLSRMLAAVARHRHSSMSDVSIIAGDIAARELKDHMRRAYPLAVVATLSPMLGLLGTVIGMIGAFDKVSAAGTLGDASLLGADISKALITTGAGLVIAVPSLALYHYFRSRVSLFGSMLEEEASDLITSWYLEGGSTSSESGVASTSAGEAAHAD